MKERFIQFGKQAIADLRACAQELLVFDLTFKFFVFLFLSPAVTWLFSAFVGSTGKYVLSDFEIAQYLLSPLGITGLLVLGASLLFINMLEITGMFHILLSHTHGRKASLVETVARVLGHHRQVLKLAVVISGVFLILTAPFLFLIAHIALPLISAFDINYYLAERPPEFWRAISIAAPVALVYLAIVLYLYLAWTFSLLLVLYRDYSPIRALRESRELVQKNLSEVATVILIWTLTIAIGSSVLSTVGLFGAEILLTLPSTVTGTLIIISLILIAQFVTLYLASLATITTRCSVLIRLYLALSDEEVSLRSGEERSTTFLRYIASLPKAAWITAGLVLLCVTGIIGYRELGSLNTQVTVSVIAHRGSSADAPENTMAAIRLGVEEGADSIEIDVQETSDGEIVVIHDKDLKRISGDERKIGKVSFDDVKDLDIGSWFDPKFSGERLPRLKDVVEACRGRAKLTVELKYTPLEEALAERVLKILEEEEFLEHSEIMSLDYSGIQQTHQINPEIPVGFLSNVSVGDLTNTEADFLAVSGNTATRRFIRNAHAAEKQVYVWTINTPREMALFIDRGADGLITDKPAIAREVIEDLNARTIPERLLLRLSNQLGLRLPERYEQ